MGSFQRDNPCYLQYHNGRPLSVALTEPCDCDRSPHYQRNFTLQHHPRSQSSGRRVHQESYRIYHPNVQYAAFNYSPPYARRFRDYDCGRDAFVENFETVTFEEQCRPNYGCVSYVRAPSPIIRHVKIRSRPSSCVDLHKKESTDNQWKKIVDERTEEHHDWHYNYTVPIQHASSSTVFGQHTSGTSAANFNIPIPPRIVRPATKDVATITDSLPKKPIRPLSISETQVLDRYEKREKIRRDSITDTSSCGFITTERPLYSCYDDNDDSDERQYKRASTKAHRKDFIQRIHARNGAGLRSYNSFNIHSDHGKNQMIIRPTVKPREALVDAPSIIAPPGSSEPSTPITIESSSQCRSYFQTN